MKKIVGFFLLISSLASLHGVIDYNDLCERLGIDPSVVSQMADGNRENEFKKAYKKYALKNHPDKNQNVTHEVFAEVSNAYKELGQAGFKSYIPSNTFFSEEEQSQILKKTLSIGLPMRAARFFVRYITLATSMYVLNDLFKKMYFNKSISFIISHYSEMQNLLENTANEQELITYIQQQCPLYKKSSIKTLNYLVMNLKSDVLPLLSSLFSQLDLSVIPFKMQGKSEIQYNIKPFFYFQDCVETAATFGNPDAYLYDRVGLIISMLMRLAVTAGTSWWLQNKSMKSLAHCLIKNKEVIDHIMGEFNHDYDLIKVTDSLKGLLKEEQFASWKTYIIPYILKALI